MRPPSVCNKPGCPNLNPCALHAVKPWAGSTRRQRLPKQWPALRARILKRDHHTCQQCGQPATDVDHITAGDDHTFTNLQALCDPCHKTKTAQEAAHARGQGDDPKPLHTKTELHDAGVIYRVAGKGHQASLIDFSEGAERAPSEGAKRAPSEGAESGRERGRIQDFGGGIYAPASEVLSEDLSESPRPSREEGLALVASYRAAVQAARNPREGEAHAS